ncbi:DUF397 domain-containing protein [Streptomyces sp. NPDC059459]|uniref:DUF397 domain-containing protein n=1 Tax=unclassified Streptomyces TaxID=2593676 RepID=UPI0036C907EF
MSTPTGWRKSSYSGGGEGNACVEVAPVGDRIALRDSKRPTDAALSFPAPAFTAFLRTPRTPAGE